MTVVGLICPQCRTSLSFGKDKYFCSNCFAVWQIKSGVVCLSQLPSYWHIISQEKMQAVVSEARKNGWSRALLESNDPEIRGLYFFTECPSRADGTFYLSMGASSVVLDLGSGLGNYTFALSPRVEHVFSADSCLESLEFIALRAEQDGLRNITPVYIEPLDFGRIPFADQSFDMVIMNGVLEWVGSYLKKGDPLEMQKNCLKEVWRILKPKGEVWIGIENRFGLSYFRGAPDDHLRYYTNRDIAYTTILPRFLANFITKRRLGIPYRTYTHSLWGLKRLLRYVGFKEIKFYYPEDGYRASSTKIYPLESVEVRNCMRSRLPKPWQKVISFLRLEQALCDSYFILAKK